MLKHMQDYLPHYIQARMKNQQAILKLPICFISLYIFKNIIHYSFLTDALNCLHLSSKSSNRSKLEHAGESNTQSPDDEIL